MVQCARVIGGAGTGKTSMMLDIMEKAMERPEVARNPYALGFSSFTRAARSEAASRAAAAWGVGADDFRGRGGSGPPTASPTGSSRSLRGNCSPAARRTRSGSQRP